MAKSEIDDIFAAKGKTKPDPLAASSSAVQEKKKKKKKKSKDAAKADEPPADDDDTSKSSSKRRIPETVVDTSAKLEASPAKRAKVEKTAGPSDAPKKKKTKKEDKDEETEFRDSRGTGPRRRTEEGFAIYKEDELGISPEGGDTPLCPFDCECCF